MAIRITLAVWAGALLLWTFPLAPAAHAAPSAHRSCYDLDDDGVCQDTDPSIDYTDPYGDYDSIDISGYDYVDDDHPNVGLVLDSPPLGRYRYGVFTNAPGDVHVLGSLSSRSYVSFTVDSDGDIYVADRTTISTGNAREGDEISIEFSGRNVHIGDRVRIQSTAAYSPELLIDASESFTIGQHVKIQLSGMYSYLEAYGATTTVGAKSSIAVGKQGTGAVYSTDGNCVADRFKMSGQDLALAAGGDGATLRLVDSVIRSQGQDNDLSMRAGGSIELVRTVVRSSNATFDPPPTVTP